MSDEVNQEVNEESQQEELTEEQEIEQLAAALDDKEEPAAEEERSEEEEQQQAAVEEEPPAEEKKDNKEERISARWNNLLKKENELRKEKARIKDLEAKVEQFSGLFDKIKKDPTAAFAELFSADDYKAITLAKLGKKEEEAPETPRSALHAWRTGV